MMRLNSPRYEIRLDDDPNYTFGSADNLHVYDRVYRLDGGPAQHSSRLSVRVISREDDSEIANCIFASAHGYFHEHLALINGESLILAVGLSLVSLHLPTLEMSWKTQTDNSICIGVRHSPMQKCYISQGGVSVARVSYDGRIEWTDSGTDFNSDGFEVTEDCVKAVDWEYVVYTWDIRTGDRYPDGA